VKEETFMVQKGYMRLEIGPPDAITTHILREGETYHCPPNTIHRMIAITEVDVIEVSTPELNDVVRVEDDYGR
jgi:quercetin dioxygenase-like cupin family protein